ncbi:MAG: hypothetical protein ACLFVD_02345 [Dehalococcoidia bacterium]
MALHKSMDPQGRKEQDGEQRKRKKVSQRPYDQLSASGDGVTDVAGPGLVERHAALLAKTQSDEQRASTLTQLQQSYGNAYVQEVMEHIQSETFPRQDACQRGTEAGKGLNLHEWAPGLRQRDNIRMPQAPGGPAGNVLTSQTDSTGQRTQEEQHISVGAKPQVPALQRQEAAPTAPSSRETWRGGVIGSIKEAYDCLKKDPPDTNFALILLHGSRDYLEKVKQAYGPGGPTGKTEPAYWLLNAFGNYVEAHIQDITAHAFVKAKPFEKVREDLNPNSKEMKTQIDAIAKAM